MFSTCCVRRNTLTECYFCHQGPGKEGENRGLYRYNYAMVQMKLEPAWAHHECMKKAIADFRARGEEPAPATNEVIRDNNRVGKTSRVLPAKTPAPKADDGPPAPKATKAGKGTSPKGTTKKAAPAHGAAQPAPTGTAEELLAKAVALGYVEQPSPNNGVRVMRIKNFLKNYKGKAA